jgi:hypothetical protein
MSTRFFVFIMVSAVDGITAKLLNSLKLERFVRIWTRVNARMIGLNKYLEINNGERDRKSWSMIYWKSFVINMLYYR